MKKVVFLLVALMGMATSAVAQNYDSNRQKAMYDASSKFIVVDKKFAVMNYPVTYYDYYAVTGKKANGRNSITAVMPMSTNDRARFSQAASAIDKKMTFHVATTNELQQALQKKLNIQSEAGPYNFTTQGFYLAMDYQRYLRMQSLRKQYGGDNVRTSSNKSSKLIGTSNKEGDIFNIQ